MKKTFLLISVPALVLTLAACGDDDDSGSGTPAVDVVVVTFANISAPGAVTTSDGGSHDVAFAPGLWVVHGDQTQLFAPASPAGDLEHLAEDGNPKPLFESIKDAPDVTAIGTFQVLSGEDYTESPIMPGESVSFDFEAEPGARISMATMYGLSNDIFVATDPAGYALYDEDGELRAGDFTPGFGFWDAGTEVNEEPGLGSFQPHSQPGPDTGDDEGGNVAPVDGTDSAGNSYPALSGLISVSVSRRP